MTPHAKQREEDREAVDEREQELDRDDAVDQPREESFGEDRVLFDEFGEVVES